jgi:hypothetical protein
VQRAGAAPPPLHSTTDPTPIPMALKASGEGPKPLVDDSGGSVSRSEQSGRGFGPRWSSRVVVVHLRWWDLVAVVRCSRHDLDCGGGTVVTSPLGGGGGGGGHTTDLVSRGSWPASLALILGARVPVGQPRGPNPSHLLVRWSW